MSIQDLLKDLQKNYLSTLPDKVVLIENLWKTNKLDLLETEYHKLKGTGRTYGLAEITLVGAALERLCELNPQVLDRAVPLSLVVLNRIREQRNSGQVPNLDNDSDFSILVAMVEDATQATSLRTKS